MPRKDSESSSSSPESRDREDETLSSDVVVNKYQMAAQMTNEIMKVRSSHMLSFIEIVVNG